MSDVKALIQANSLGLDEEKKEQLLRQASVGALSFLSPDREAGPFMLFCCGESLEEISVKTNVPMPILLVTAMQYNWADKSAILRQDPADIQKSLTNSMLVATWMAAKEQLAGVLSGKIKASDCSLIPKNPAGVEKLMQMVNAVNGIQAAPTTPSAPISVTANNVQINQTPTNTPQVSEEKSDKGKEGSDEKAEKLKRLESLGKT